jgi:hypothetical protein
LCYPCMKCQFWTRSAEWSIIFLGSWIDLQVVIILKSYGKIKWIFASVYAMYFMKM